MKNRTIKEGPQIPETQREDRYYSSLGYEYTREEIENLPAYEGSTHTDEWFEYENTHAINPDEVNAFLADFAAQDEGYTDAAQKVYIEEILELGEDDFADLEEDEGLTYE